MKIKDSICSRVVFAHLWWYYINVNNNNNNNNNLDCILSSQGINSSFFPIWDKNVKRTLTRRDVLTVDNTLSNVFSPIFIHFTKTPIIVCLPHHILWRKKCMTQKHMQELLPIRVHQQTTDHCVPQHRTYNVLITLEKFRNFVLRTFCYSKCHK